ncbi:hypothetical protein KR059_008932, partial [Drosophila kikkawai]
AYSDYLNTFIKPKDLRYLPVGKIRHRLVPLRTQVGEVVLSPSKFKLSLKGPESKNFHFNEIYSIANDPLTLALGERKNQNATKIISTIVFISTRDSKGFNVSGYIDLEQSIRRFREGDPTSHSWSNILAGNRRLQPNSQDLSFIAWKNGRVFYNDTDNYKVIPDPVRGLCFSFKGDGAMIYIEKKITEDHPSCLFIESPMHGSAVIYDHRIRRKL